MMSTVRTRKQSKRHVEHSGHRSVTGAGLTKDTALQLAPIVASAGTQEQLYEGLLAWLTRRPNCVGAAVFFNDDGQEIAAGPHQLDNPILDSTSFRSALNASATHVCRSGNAHTASVEKVRNLAIVSVPILVEGRNHNALSGAVVIDSSETPDDSSLLIAAAYATMWHSHRQHEQTREDLQTTAATLDLLSSLAEADGFRAATITLVNSLREHLQSQGVVLGLNNNATGRCRISAMSGLVDFNSNAVMIQTIEDALDESIARDRLSVFPVADSSNRDALLGHQKLCHDLQASRVVSHPLKTAQGETIGAWLIVDDAEKASDPAAPILLRAASSRVAGGINTARRANSTVFGNRVTRRTKVRWLLRTVVAAAVFTAIMMFPVSYRIHSECSAEPDVRRFIVAPHEGLLEKTFVEPGDVVTSGQLLAKMDGRDVRWELAGLAAQKQKAAKNRDSGLLEGDAAASQRADLEFKRIVAREKVLLRQKEQLQLHAPIDGIVLDGHLDRVENAPVTVGQALYEIAPLSPVTVEVAIADDEFVNVEAGFAVFVRFDGIARTFEGTIGRIRPRSEIRDGNNVFIAEVILQNADSQLRPGMMGYASVKGKTRTLGWTLFHKPWEHLQKSLPF